jgi:hypothetical protein
MGDIPPERVEEKAKEHEKEKEQSKASGKDEPDMPVAHVVRVVKVV